MACYNGSNNQYYNFPPFMNDGRNFTDLRPEAIINENIRQNQHINTNWKYRRYLQENSNKIIEVNQLMACDECSACPYYNTGQITNVPFLYHLFGDKTKPIGYETSDLKELYLSKEILESRMKVPSLDQDMLLTFKRSN